MNTLSSATANTVSFDSLHTRLEKANLELGVFYPYDATVGVPEIEGCRAVKCLYKASKDGKKENENSFVLIPTAHLTDELVAARIDELAPYLTGYLQGVEDTDIKAQHKKNASRIYTEYLSLDKIIEALEASEAGTRLNAEKIEKWFTDNLADSLILAFATKLGIEGEPTEEQIAKIEQVVNAYNKKFQSLAGGRTVLKENDCKAMVIAIRAADADSTVLGRRFIARLEGMKEIEEEVLLSL